MIPCSRSLAGRQAPSPRLLTMRRCRRVSSSYSMSSLALRGPSRFTLVCRSILWPLDGYTLLQDYQTVPALLLFDYLFIGDTA